MSEAKDDLIVMGVVGTGVLVGVYLVSKGIGDMIPDVEGWVNNVLSSFKMPNLFGWLKAPEEIPEVIPQTIDPTGVLNEWYDDALSKIKDLTIQVSDLKNDVGGTVMTVSTGITDLGGNIEEIIEKSATAKETISTIIEDAGGIVSSGTEEAVKIIEAAKDIIAWQVPGWMPVGEV